MIFMAARYKNGHRLMDGKKPDVFKSGFRV
jgi:hypothetical protein